MKKIYTHPNQMLVENAKNLLTASNIEVSIKNEFASSGVGELSAIDTWPEIWVKDEQFDQAKLIVSKLLSTEEGPAWECLSCKEVNGQNFESCWHCQSENPNLR